MLNLTSFKPPKNPTKNAKWRIFLNQEKGGKSFKLLGYFEGLPRG
jgi:hypothetical protein